MFLVYENIKVILIVVSTSGLSSLGVPGVPWHTQILADQLTLFQPGGTDYVHLIKYYWHTLIFRPSDGPELDRHFREHLINNPRMS